jgi:hypothetical protein
VARKVEQDDSVAHGGEIGGETTVEVGVHEDAVHED